MPVSETQPRRIDHAYCPERTCVLSRPSPAPGLSPPPRPRLPLLPRASPSSPAQRDVGAKHTQKAAERDEAVHGLRRRRAARAPVDEGREAVDDGGAEERPRHADNDADVLDGARHRSNDGQQRHDQRHARRVGRQAAEGAPGDHWRSLEIHHCTGRGDRGAPRGGGQRGLGRQGGGHADEGRAQPDHSEGVAEEDRGAGGEAADDGERVRGGVVEEEVRGGVVAKRCVAEAHHRRVEDGEHAKSDGDGARKLGRGTGLEVHVEGGRVVVRDEGEAEVGDEDQRVAVEARERGESERRRALRRKRREELRGGGVGAVEGAHRDKRGGVEDGDAPDGGGEGEGGEVLEQRERAEDGGGERDDDSLPQPAGGGDASEPQQRREDVAEDARVDDGGGEAHQGDAAVDNPRGARAKSRAPEALEVGGAGELARGADEVEGVARDGAERHADGDRRHPPDARSHTRGEGQDAGARDVVDNLNDRHGDAAANGLWRRRRQQRARSLGCAASAASSQPRRCGVAIGRERRLRQRQRRE
mmetsp:Transcript_27060/g.89068  ORF Transcript_27060/g.89068 Transcript_27060/m.89068 type:complete len:531 (-) Transcript_27060:121-1713(-)